MDIWDELLKRISSKGDIGAIAGGFVCGYLVSLKFSSFGLAPGTGAGLGATAAIGLKNGLEAIWDTLWRKANRGNVERRELEELEQSASEIEQIATNKPDLAALIASFGIKNSSPTGRSARL